NLFMNSTQCSRRACRNADRPSMSSSTTTVSRAQNEKATNRAKQPPNPSRLSPMASTMPHSTSDSWAWASDRAHSRSLISTIDSSIRLHLRLRLLVPHHGAAPGQHLLTAAQNQRLDQQHPGSAGDDEQHQEGLQALIARIGGAAVRGFVVAEQEHVDEACGRAMHVPAVQMVSEADKHAKQHVDDAQHHGGLHLDAVGEGDLVAGHLPHRVQAERVGVGPPGLRLGVVGVQLERLDAADLSSNLVGRQGLVELAAYAPAGAEDRSQEHQRAVPEVAVHHGEQEREGHDGEGRGVRLAVGRHAVRVDDALEAGGQLVDPERQVNLVQIVNSAPGLGDKALVGGLNIEHVQCVVDGFDLADLDEPQAEVLGRGHEHSHPMVHRGVEHGVEVLDPRHHADGHLAPLRLAVRARVQRGPESFADLLHPSLQLLALEEDDKHRLEHLVAGGRVLQGRVDLRLLEEDVARQTRHSIRSNAGRRSRRMTPATDLGTMEVEVAHPSQPNASRFDESAAAAMSLPQPPAPQQRSGNTRSGHTSLQQKRPAPVDGSKILRNDEVYRQLFEAQVQLTDQLAGTRWWRENKPAVKQVKSSRDLSLPVVRNAAPATSRGMLAGRQADWTRALENDGRTENPVVARQTAEWLDLVRPSKLRSDVIDRIKEKRRERHNLTLEEMHQELYQVGVTFEPLIVQRCQSLHETLAKLEEELDRRLSPLATNESLMALDQHQLLGLWQGVAEVFADRRNAIGSLDEDLLALESDRVTEIRRVFHSYSEVLERVSHLAPAELHRIVDDEAVQMNQTLLGNQRSFADLNARLVMSELDRERRMRAHWQDKITEWRAGHVEVAVAGFHQFVQSPQSILSNMRAEQSEINSRRLELIEELSSLAPPNACKSGVAAWHQKMQQVCKMLDETNQKYLQQVYEDYERSKASCLTTSHHALLGHEADCLFGHVLVVQRLRVCVLRRMCFSSAFTSRSSFSSFSRVASRSTISRGFGASGLSPVSRMGMPSLRISSLQVAQLPLHLVAAADFVDKFPLEGVGVGLEVAELHQAELPQLRHAGVGSFSLQEQLAEGHLLTAEQVAHGCWSNCFYKF
uniref:DUF4455 domain-containing protein n=1 Tax=Macrostomum lignano TaxID=282301 RepID=A0A1I8G7P7_9PLAT